LHWFAIAALAHSLEYTVVFFALSSKYRPESPTSSLTTHPHYQPTALQFTMPRRAPPSALRLVQGPIPPRSQPKHVMPCLPPPAFCPEEAMPRGSSPPPRSRRLGQVVLRSTELSPLAMPLEFDANSSRTSLALSTPTSSPSSPSSSPVGMRIRGPWEHSSSISDQLQVDIDSLLAIPKPAAYIP